MKRFFLSVFIIHYLLILPSSVGMADSTLLPRGPAGETILGLGTLSDAAYSPAGNYIATGGSLGVLLWESETGRLARVLYSGAQAVQCLAFTPGGDHLVAVGTDQSVLWDVESGRPLLSFPTKPMNPAVGISPDGQYVYIGNYDALTTQYMAEMWSLKTGTIVNQIGWSSGPFQSITVSPDTQYLLTTSGSSTQVWDIYSGALLVNYPYGGLGAKAIFSPDGNQVLIQSTDFSNAYLFNLFNTKELYVFSHKTKPDDISRDHYVFGAAFSPDGKQVVTISFNAIQVWDTATGILLRTLDGPLVTIRNDSSSNVSRIPPECYVISPRCDTFLCVDRALVNYTYSVSLWSLETGDRADHRHIHSARRNRGLCAGRCPCMHGRRPFGASMEYYIRPGLAIV